MANLTQYDHTDGGRYTLTILNDRKLMGYGKEEMTVYGLRARVFTILHEKS